MSLNELIHKAFELGNSNNVDFLVKDIYGEELTGFDLDLNLLASSLGKVKVTG